MSYEVLARKWRPQTFDEVIGQEHITHTLRKAVETGRIAHAYLFSGPRGCGKTTTARILAKVINCPSLQGGNPCNQCPSCLGVVKGNNLDVMEIDGASHTGVNEVRDLQESIGYAPSQHKNKVYIIDEVHMLSNHAFNALLKTLEEPPPRVYFVFATTAPHKVPETIKSRCQKHNFKRLEISEIADQLEKICRAEEVEYEGEALRLLARKAEGSMRDGESLLDQCITSSGGEVSTASVRKILGMLDQEKVFSFLERIAARDPTGVLKELDKAVDEGIDLQELSNALLEGFRDLMILSSPGDLRELLYHSQDEIAYLEKLLPNYELADLVTIVERLCNLAPRLKAAGDPRILLETALVDLSLLDHQIDIRTLIERLEGSGGAGSGEKGSPSGRSRRGADSPPGGGARLVAGRGARSVSRSFAKRGGISSKEESPSSAPAGSSRSGEAHSGPLGADGLDEGSLRESWKGFVTLVRQKKVSLGVCLISAALEGFDGHTVFLRFAKGFSFQRAQVEEPSNRRFLKGMMKKYFGLDLDLACLGEGGEVRGASEARAEGARDGEKLSSPGSIENQKIVRKIMQDFDGEIVRF